VESAELVGGVLYDAEDPVATGRELVELLTSDRVDEVRTRDAGLEPVLVSSLKRKLGADRNAIELACAGGVGWVLGRRSSQVEDTWEVVASLPGAGAGWPDGLRRATAETLIGLASTARRRVRLTAPYIDEPGIGFLADAIAAATRRGVEVDLFDPVSWEPARAAMLALTDSVRSHGEPYRLRLVRAVSDAPFSHLKVLVVDGSAA
jgi:hypothetical protein